MVLSDKEQVTEILSIYYYPLFSNARYPSLSCIDISIPRLTDTE
ncbi:hypothetical protein JOC83_001704 [Bacillus iocasae]|uniref:Uncharacterized protein n=1 Tax=Priestia iocasae TaxID=2291674 RepID=A0ABS2QTV3_9BACI|nr:hypothetical protein [Metabacillus iocasae]